MQQNLIVTSQQQDTVVNHEKVATTEDDNITTQNSTRNDVIAESSTTQSVTATRNTTRADDEDVHTTYYITVYPLKGRLGNEMFRYASLQGLAQLTHHTPIIRCKRLAKNFPVIAEKCIRSERKLRKLLPTNTKTNINADLICTYETSLVESARAATDKHIAITGYLQSWKYFRNSSTTIRKHFQFAPAVTRYASEYMQSMIDQYKREKNLHGDVTVVGVHVRRNDMMRKLAQKIGLSVATLDYFQTAMNYFRTQRCTETHCVFILASDDVTWCQDNLMADDVIIIADHKTAVTSHQKVSDVQRDMGVLRLVEHSILSTGTFSWWIGWFTPGQVVYYKNYIKKDSRMDRKFTAEDYFPPHWTGM